MTWIATGSVEKDEQLQQALQETMQLYPPEYAIPVDCLAEHNQGEAAVVMSHSLLPKVLKHAFCTYGELLSPDLPLSRRQHELIAATVSTLNDCFY